MVKATTSSTIRIKRVTYTVPSRLIGEILRVHVYHDRLKCYVGSELVITLKRIYSNGQNYKRSIDYRHLVNSLVRKPQAFRYSQIRDDLLPNDDYRLIWNYVDEVMPPRKACQFIVGLLKIASERDNEIPLAKEVLRRIHGEEQLDLRQLENRYKTKKSSELSEVKVNQHILSYYDQLLKNVEVRYDA